MFNCIKTGFYADLCDGTYLYGDAFSMNGTDWPHDHINIPSEYLLLRVTSLSVKPPPAIHITLYSWAHWFEETAGKPYEGGVTIWHPCSTLIANPGQWSWLGYEGVAP